MLPFSGGFVELFAGAFGFGRDASLEGEFFPFGELFLWRWGLFVEWRCCCVGIKLVSIDVEPVKKEQQQ